MRYTEDAKAVALAMLEATRGSVSEVSRKCKIPRRTIAHWAKGERVNDDVATKAQQKKVDLSDRLEELAHALINAAFDADKIGESSLKDILVGAGISIDKMQLLRNKPTSITNDTSLLPESELNSRIAALERGEIPPPVRADGADKVPA
jgi:hypothetical protein